MATWNTSGKVLGWEGERQFSFNDETRMLRVKVADTGKCDGPGVCPHCINRENALRTGLVNYPHGITRDGAGSLFLELLIPPGNRPLEYFEQVTKEAVIPVVAA